MHCAEPFHGGRRPQPRNSPAALPRRCPQTGHGLGDRKVGLGREPARGHTLKFVGHAPGPIGAAAPASAPGSPKRPGGRPVRLSASGSQLPRRLRRYERYEFTTTLTIESCPLLPGDPGIFLEGFRRIQEYSWISGPGNSVTRCSVFSLCVAAEEKGATATASFFSFAVFLLYTNNSRLV